MPQAIRLREVVRERTLELAADEVILRVPYDLFQPEGPARLRGALVQWIEGGAIRTGRVAAAQLGDTHPGERVLIRHGASNDQVPIGDPTDDEWWLCEVQAVDGVIEDP